MCGIVVQMLAAVSQTSYFCVSLSKKGEIGYKPNLQISCLTHFRISLKMELKPCKTAEIVLHSPKYCASLCKKGVGYKPKIIYRLAALHISNLLENGVINPVKQLK